MVGSSWGMAFMVMSTLSCSPSSATMLDSELSEEQGEARLMNGTPVADISSESDSNMIISTGSFLTTTTSSSSDMTLTIYVWNSDSMQYK
jgi:hypothetical protein